MASQSPLGEKTTSLAPSLPGMRVIAVDPSSRVTRMVVPPESLMAWTTRRPSGEIATTVNSVAAVLARNANSTRAPSPTGTERASIAQTASAAQAIAAPPAIIAIRRHFRPSLSACAFCGVRRVANRPSSAAANSAAEANRSAGSFSSACATAAATCAGTDFRNSVTGRGVSAMIFMMICCAEFPIWGGSPVSIS